MLLVASSRSEASLWMSACAAMQASSALESISKGQPRQADARQVRLKVDVSVAEVSLSLLPPPMHKRCIRLTRGA